MSTKATIGVSAARAPALRAAAGPELWRRRRSVAPRTPLSGVPEPSSTNITPAVSRQWRSMSYTRAGAVSWVGTTTVTSLGVKRWRRRASGSGRTGWIAPASSSCSVSRDGATGAPAAISSNGRRPPQSRAEQAQRRAAEHGRFAAVARRRRSSSTRRAGSRARARRRRRSSRREASGCESVPSPCVAGVVDRGDEVVGQDVEEVAAVLQCGIRGIAEHTGGADGPHADRAQLGGDLGQRPQLARRRRRATSTRSGWIASISDVSVRPAWASPPGTRGHHGEHVAAFGADRGDGPCRRRRRCRRAR